MSPRLLLGNLDAESDLACLATRLSARPSRRRLALSQAALANLSGEHVQDLELMMAGSVVTVLPVLMLFVFLQRYYIAGLMAGSVKG